MKELEDLDLNNARILAFFETKTEASNSFVMIVKGGSLKSSIIVLDSDLKARDTTEFDGCKITQVAHSFHDG